MSVLMDDLPQWRTQDVPSLLPNLLSFWELRQGHGEDRVKLREGVAADQPLGQDAHPQRWVPVLGN